MKQNFVSFEFLTAALLKIQAFWDVNAGLSSLKMAASSVTAATLSSAVRLAVMW
jgi:hypothetical protein